VPRTARFVAALPAPVRAAPTPHTAAQALTVARPGQAHAVIAAFVSGADAGLRVIGVVVLVAGALVLAQSRLSGRSTRRAAAPGSHQGALQ
jgi:uncharacterized protein YjeT (DUF2065 family)